MASAAGPDVPVSPRGGAGRCPPGNNSSVRHRGCISERPLRRHAGERGTGCRKPYGQARPERVPGGLEHVTNNTWYLSFPNPDDQVGYLTFAPGESGAAGFTSEEFGPFSGAWGIARDGRDGKGIVGEPQRVRDDVRYDPLSSHHEKGRDMAWGLLRTVLLSLHSVRDQHHRPHFIRSL